MKKYLFVLTALVVLGASFGVAQAQTIITLDSIEEWVNTIVDFISYLAGALMTFFIVWAGIRWMSAGDDQKKVDSAKAMLKSAVIGIIVIIGVNVIIDSIQYFIDTGDLEGRVSKEIASLIK